MKPSRILSKNISSLLFLGAAALFPAAPSTPAATVTWDGGGVGGTDIGVAVNWSGDTLPSVVTPDIALWDGTVGGPLALLYNDGSLAGAAGNAGLNLSLAATQTGSLNIDSGANIGSLRVNSVTIAAGAGTFSLGDGAGTFNVTLGGAAGTQTFTNNSLSTATVASDVVFGTGGGGAHTLALAGAGNWVLNNVITNSSGTVSVSKSDAGTLTLTGLSTYTGGLALNAGTLNFNNAAAAGNTITGAITITGGTLDNTSGAAITTTTAKAMTWNGDFTFTGTNNLSTNLGAVTISTATRTVNIAGGVLTTGLINSAAGIGLTKTGAGTLFMANTLNTSSVGGTLDMQGGKLQVAGDFTVGGLTGSATIENGGAGSKWFLAGNANGTQTFSGTIQGNPGNAAVRLGFVKQGTGTQTLSGTNSVLDALRIDAGTLNITGTTTTGYAGIANNTANAGQAKIGTGTANAIITVNGGTLNANRDINTSFIIGAAANSKGFVNMTSGAINTVNQFNIGNGAGAAGTNPYAAFTMSGGTLNSGSWLVVGANNDRAVLNQSGGIINVVANRMTVGAGGSGSIGVVNVSGGTLNSVGGIFLGENGQGIINTSSTGAVNSGVNTMQFAGNAASTAGTLNLNGGTLAAGSITKGTSAAVSVYRINFNGGTVKANTSSTTFLANLALTTGYVNSGGAIFDTNTFDDTVAMPLLAPTGQGLNAIAVATGGAGYIDTPIVTITGGTGTGAQAVANVSGGAVTGFTITNPGVGYTAGDVLTPVLFGGGATTAATVGAITLTANTSGGLTKNGVGTLTLSGASSYTGNVQINTGTVVGANTNIGNPTTGAFGNSTIAGRTVTVASGATLRLTSNDSFGNQLATAANLPSVIVNGTFVTTNYNQVGAITLNGATMTASNAGSVAQYQNFQFLGDITVGGSAPSFINSTVAAGLDGNHLNTSTTFNVADVTSSAATDLTVSTTLRDRSNNYGNTAGALVKTGLGKMELAGSSVYTGSTTVSNGTLLLSGAGAVNSSSGITVNGAGAKLVQNSSAAVTPVVTLTSGTVDGTGTINTVNAAAGATIANGDGGTGVLTIGTLTHGSPATYNLTTNSTSPVLVTTTLTTNGGIITINANNASWTNGLTYNLVGYTTLNGALADFTKGTVANLGARQSATLANPAGFISLTIAGDLPVWTGLQTTAWTTAAIGGNSNWKLQTATNNTDFLTNDAVLFADTIPGGGAPANTTADITQAGGVATASVTFNNSSVAYTVTASGGSGITSGTLIKNGTAALTLGGAHTYTGATNLNDGTTNLTGTLGNTAVTVAAPATLSLQAANAISQNTLTVNGALAQTVNNALSGTAALVLNNGATLGNANSHSGGTALNNGTLNINSNTALGTGTFTIAGGTIDNTSGGTVTFTNNNPQRWTSNVTFTGTQALNMGAGVVTLGNDAAAQTIAIANNSGLGGIPLTVGGAITAAVGGTAGLKMLNISGANTALTGNITVGSATGVVINDNVPGTLTLSGAASTITTLNVNGGAGSIVDVGGGNLSLANGGGGILQSTTGGTISGSGSVTIGSVGGDFGTAGGTTLTVNAKIAGTNQLDFFNANGGAGFGTIVLAAANTHTGPVNVENTRVVIPAGGAINALNTANSGQITIGDVAALPATLELNGGTINATRTAAPALLVGAGNGAVANLNMTGGAINATNELWVANGVGTQGAFTMSAGTVNTGSWFVVGRTGGTGTLNLNGGTITKGGAATNFIIIGSLGGTGTVNQTAGQFNATAGGIRIGENSGATPALNGLWDMTGGSSTVTGEINVAWRSSQGTWNVSGATTTVNATGRLIVGAETANVAINTGPIVNGAPVGTVNISGGSVTFAGGDSRIGGDNSNVSVNAQGNVNVSGTGVLNFGGNVQIGAYGVGNLTISGSGIVNSTGGFPSIGRYVGGVGTLNVNGGTFNQVPAVSALIVGEEGTGTLNVNSGLVDVQELRLGNLATGNGTVNLNGGTLFTKVVSKVNAGATTAFKFNGGVLKAKADAADFLLGLPSASVSIENGGAVIDTDGHIVKITQDLADSGGSTGGLTKQGAGTLTLTGVQTYPTLNGNGGTTNLKNTLGTGTSTINVNANASVATDVSQTLAALNIADGGVFTVSSTPLPGGDVGGGNPAPPESLFAALPEFAADAPALASGPAAVPEPGSAALLLGGVLALLGRRKRRA